MHLWIISKLLNFLLLINVFLILFSLYNIGFLDKVHNSVVEEEVLVEPMPSISNVPTFQLENKVSDFLNLMISNTDIVIPIVQGSDNSYYLSHASTGKENKMGTPFLDYRNHLDDQKLLIYGHNSRTLKTEFHILEKYLNPSFFKEHPILILKGKDFTYHYQIFSILIITDDFQHMKLGMNHEEYQNHLKWLRSHSIYNTFVDIHGDDDILVLQTCYYQPKDSYLLVVSKKLK